MVDKKELPSRQRMRLENYDYSLHGLYFITIVTKSRINRFGEIKEGEMHLNDAGHLVVECYQNLSKRYEDIECLDFVVMPNHLHFIICLLSDHIFLPELIRYLKSKTTVGYIRGIKQHLWPPFHDQLWQKGYYDHIIRNERAFKYIKNYIYHNPERWFFDKINPDASSTTDDIFPDLKELY